MGREFRKRMSCPNRSTRLECADEVYAFGTTRAPKATVPAAARQAQLQP
jgi:hypothetical protein